MKKILVPFDFSKPAINAYRVALDIARKSKGAIHVLNVIELPIVADSMAVPVVNYEQSFLAELEEKAQQNFNKVEKKYPKRSLNLKFSVKIGGVLTTLQEYIKKEKIDLVVMGSHGARGAREFFVGSNAERMVRLAQVPVLIVKEYVKGQIKDIVFPNALDLNDKSDLVKRVKALQEFLKARLHLVWINTPLNFVPDTDTLPKMEAFAKKFKLKNFTTDVFNYWNEEQGIAAYGSMMKADLVALGTHSRRGIAHLLEGSLAEDVVNHNHGMVWTYSLKNKALS